MPGIIVGTDGSAHSRRALEWAIREAGVRRAPLTVVSVYQAIHDYWGDITSPGVHALAEEARKTAREETDGLAGALVAGIAPRTATAIAAVLLLEIVISLTATGGLSDLTLRDVGVLGLP